MLLMRCMFLLLLCCCLFAEEQKPVGKTIENLADDLSFAINLQDNKEALSCWANADHIAALSKKGKVSISEKEQKKIKKLVSTRDAATKAQLKSLYAEAKSRSLDLSSLTADKCTLTDNNNAIFKGNKNCTIVFKSKKGFSLRIKSTGVRKLDKKWLFVDGISEMTLIKNGKEIAVPKQTLP